MAIIGRLRKKAWLLVAFIGISLLLFVVGLGDFKDLRNTSDALGVVNGEKIRYPEFEKKVEQLIENYKANTKSENIDQNTTDMLREQAWSTAVSDNTLGKEYKKLGVSCSPEELYDMTTGKNPHPQITQAFTDPKTGIFDPQAVVRFLKNLPNADEATQKQWANFETAMREERIANKYKDLLKQSMFVTSLEAKNAYMEAGRIANLKFVQLNYSSLPDSSVKAEESDLKTYYNAHQNDYKQAETIRKAEFVMFDITPSSEDKQEVQDWIAKKKEEFATSTNDTLFVNQNSDVAFDTTTHPKGTLSPILDTTLFGAAVGTIVGPYEEASMVKLSKLVGRKEIPDSIKISHALVAYKGSERANPNVARSYEEAKSRADSLYKIAKSDVKAFVQIAKAESDDVVSATKEGDLGWLNKQSGMDEQFKAGYLTMGKGDVKLVESKFGFHIMRAFDISKGRKPELGIATVVRKIEPSQKTYDALYNKANQFAASNNTGESFDSACVKQGLSKRVADNVRESDKNLPGLEQARDLVRWMYKAEKGEVSKAYTVGDKYVIAHLTNIREKGFLPLEDVKPQVTAGVIKEKKAEALMEKFTKQSAGATNIDAVAQKLNTPAMDADNVSFMNPFLPAAGSEPRVVGTAFAMKAGQLSKAIKGESGVFMITVKSFTEPAATKDYENNRKQIIDQRKSRSEYEVFNALKEKANIEDNRGKFY